MAPNTEKEMSERVSQSRPHKTFSCFLDVTNIKPPVSELAKRMLVLELVTKVMLVMEFNGRRKVISSNELQDITLFACLLVFIPYYF